MTLTRLPAATDLCDSGFFSSLPFKSLVPHRRKVLNSPSPLKTYFIHLGNNATYCIFETRLRIRVFSPPAPLPPQTAVYFVILSFKVPIIFTLHINSVLKFKFHPRLYPDHAGTRFVVNATSTDCTASHRRRLPQSTL